MILLFLACSPTFERPDDPGVPAATVGVRTLTIDGLITEIWYPAHPKHDGDATEAVDFPEALDSEVLDRLGPLDIPALPTMAVRDAEIHPDGPFPGVIFSHGFGGTRHQSVTLTTHLASRGMVVLATNHAGRSIVELVPCMFSPPMEGCELAFDDPAPPDIDALADWLESPTDGFEEAIRPNDLGLFGHSAGGMTTVTVANADTRFTAIAPMAGGAAVTRDLDVQRWAGTCDGVVPATSSAAAHDDSIGGTYLELTNAGHLAFSDLCTLDLAGLLEELSERDDVSELFVEQARQLASDGCPGEEVVPDLPNCTTFLELESSEPILNAELAAFFEHALLDSGRGPATEDSGPLRVR